LAEALAARHKSIGAAVSSGRDALAAAGCDTPRLDAELFLAEALGVGRERLVLDRDDPLPAHAVRRYRELVARRVAREPVAYILGRREFRRITLAVDRRVLIPRPETELLVELGLGLPAGLTVADVGTGSGAVALALKDERPDLTVRGLDVDADALEVARANATRLGLEVEFTQADLLDGRRYDAVLANLPYVPSGAELAPEIAGFEPAGALFAGTDGLEVVRRLVALAGSSSPPPSLLALETGPEQTRAVGKLMTAAGFATVEVLADLAGRERVVVGSA
jgi:release factor glutamine methyltransferase